MVRGGGNEFQFWLSIVWVASMRTGNQDEKMSYNKCEFKECVSVHAYFRYRVPNSSFMALSQMYEFDNFKIISVG